MTPVNILYSFRRCPYAIRARMAVLVSGVPFTLREVDLRHKPAELIAASPKGTVPVLIRADGQVIDESLDIMRWALRQNDPEDWLAGDDTALIQTIDDQFKYHLDRYKYADSGGLTDRDAGLAILQDIEQRLSLSAHLSGATRSMTDIAIMPFVRQFAAVDRAWFDAQPIPRVRQWLATLTTSPLFEQTMSNFPVALL